MGRIFFLIASLCALGIFFSCSNTSNTEYADSPPLFELLPSSRTDIKFRNKLTATEDLNTYTYRNFYNGGGVAIGDINNDSLPDLFFTGNQVSNRLYLNKGNFRFKDITEKAGVASSDVWSTGVSMADVNGDGLLDIYVCKSGPPQKEDHRKNELFINNGDLTFTEKAEQYGLAIKGLSVHASFFDYDKDRDLDMYLLSNPVRSFNNVEIVDGNIRNKHDPEGGNRLFRNNLVSKGDSLSSKGIPQFTDVTEEAGILSSKIGFGLGISVGDLNRDGWPDLYVSNDFFERDYLYLNNQDGTFEEVAEESLDAISLSSMGGDIADINHDGFPEIFVSDMLGGNENRLKTNTQFHSWKEYRELVERNYHHQFTRNTLQLNRGLKPGVVKEKKNNSGQISEKLSNNQEIYFSEIGRLAGVEASDWSWGALIADYNLDGERDIFVPNGIYKDLLNQDYLDQFSDRRAVASVLKKSQGILKLIDMMPSTPVPNKVFAGEGGLTFKDKAKSWGLGTPGFSNGAAYGDLDNDGDLDLVVNNVNMDAFVYRNMAVEQKRGRWLEVRLQGQAPNAFAVGAQVTAWAGNSRWYIEQQPVRGFQSSVETVLHLGLGNVQELDSLRVQWSDGRLSRLNSIKTNQRLTIKQINAERKINSVFKSATKGSFDPIRNVADEVILKEIRPEQMGLNWSHTESSFNDFNRQPLLFHMRSQEGPPICSGDVNNDDQDDLYVGGAKGQSGTLFIQTSDKKFKTSEQPALENDRFSEDTACTWLDANNDGNMDLYVGSGSSELPTSSSALADRLYLNDGKGQLIRSDSWLATTNRSHLPTGAVAATDYDNDGDTDLFVGDRLYPFSYGLPVDGHLLINDGSGHFQQAGNPALDKLGMITDAEWADYDNDGDPDLWVVGEWMPITLFENRKGKLVNITQNAGLDSTQGLWQSIEFGDLNGDGNMDFIAGNHGKNSVFQASGQHPLELWAGDLDKNGSFEQIVSIPKEGKRYPLALRRDFLKQLPGMSPQYPDHESYAGQTVMELFSSEQLKEVNHRRVRKLSSIVGWNQGDGRFTVKDLPVEAQLAPIYGTAITDIDADGMMDVVAGGNLKAVKPQTGGYSASYGLVIKGKPAQQLEMVSSNRSGLFVSEEIRDIIKIKINSECYIFITKNDDKLSIYKL